MNKEKLEEILNLGWEEDEKEVLSRVLNQLKYWKKWMPTGLNNDLNYILNLAIAEKKKLNSLIEKNTVLLP
jgi:hypothetical protein